MSQRAASLTAIYQTDSEIHARRVLCSIIYHGQHPQYLKEGGWITVVFPGLLPEDDAQQLNRFARAIADTDLKPKQPLSAFTQTDF